MNRSRGASRPDRYAPLLAAAAVLAASAGLAAQPARPQFRSGVELVAVNVVVTDAENRYVGGLTADDFALYEDGVRQTISLFGDARVPLDLAILLDTSASVRDRISLVQEAAAGFARTLRPGDRGMIAGFNRRVDVIEPFTSDVGALVQAIRRTHAGGSTSLYNAVYIALGELGRLAREGSGLRRQAIVVLSDGADTASTLGFDEVLDAARRAATSIYTIGIETEEPVPGVNERQYSEARFDMRALARQTGARHFTVERIEDLAAVYGDIARELAHQYSLGYVSANQRQDGSFRHLQVETPEVAGARARARPGYFASETSATADRP